MSSKVLAGDDPSAELFPWRRIQPAEGSPLGSAGGARDEVLSLRARVAQLEQEGQAQLRQARLQGVRDGENAAGQQALGQLEQALSRVAASIEETLTARDHMRRQMEEDLVRLAVLVARRILHRELSVDPEALVGVVRAAVDKMDVRGLQRIRVSPLDAPAIEKHLESLGLTSRVELVSDSGLERGAVLLETSRGILDASLSTQLQEIERGFTDLVRRR